MATTQQALTPVSDQTPAIVEISGQEPSGAQWVSRFPTSASTQDLTSPFRESTDRFLAALQAAGAAVAIAATYRPPERAYLMHWSWEIVKNGANPQSVPAYQGGNINIQWAHSSTTGAYDSAASIEGARAMVIGYGINGLNVPPALSSRHTQGKAIDMSISWSGTLSIANASNQSVQIDSLPKTGMNNALHTVGATYAVIKFVGGNADKPHWSSDGH